MKFSYSISRRRKRLVDEDKGSESADSSGLWKSGLTPIKSELTKLEADDRIKKDREVFSFDQEGNIKKIPASKVKGKLSHRKKSFDLRYLNIGYYLATPIIAGVFLGLGLDYWLKTKPFFVVFFLFLGTLSSFYNLFKLLKER